MEIYRKIYILDARGTEIKDFDGMRNASPKFKEKALIFLVTFEGKNLRVDAQFISRHNGMTQGSYPVLITRLMGSYKGLYFALDPDILVFGLKHQGISNMCDGKYRPRQMATSLSQALIELAEGNLIELAEGNMRV